MHLPKADCFSCSASLLCTKIHGLQDLYRSLAPQPTAAERSSAQHASERSSAHHSPRALARGSRKGSGSRPGGSAGSSSKSLEGLPPLQQAQAPEASAPALPTALARLPSLRKALSQPALHAEAPAALAPPPTEAEPSGEEGQAVQPQAAWQQAQASGLAPIPEQRSSEAEPAGQPPADVGHLLTAVQHKLQQQTRAQEGKAAGAANAAAADSIATVHAPAAVPGGEAAPAEQTAPAADAAHDRMREAEQRHVEKLRARSSAAAAPSLAAAAPRGTKPGKAAGGGSSGYGAGLAKSASSLLNKLLGRKPAPEVPTAPASSAAASLERSTSMGAPAAKPAQKHRLSPPPVPGHVRSSGYGQQPASPRHAPADLHPSSHGLVHRQYSGTRAAAEQSPAATVALRSPVRSTSRRLAAGTVPVPAEGSAGAEVAAGATAGSASAEASADASERVLGRALSSKGSHVRFAGLPPAGANAGHDAQASAGGGWGGEQAHVSAVHTWSSSRPAPIMPSPSATLPVQEADLIPAVHNTTTDAASFTTAFSSLPPSSLPSITASAPPSPTRTSRKGSVGPRPPASRKGSLLAAATSRSPSGHWAQPAGAGSRSTAGAAGPGRRSKVTSMPGDGRRGAKDAPALPGGRHAASGHDAPERSAASWSHPAASKSAAGQRGTSASAARLSMYRVLVGGKARPPHDP